MFVSKCLAYPLHLLPQAAFPIAATVWLMATAAPSFAGDARSLDEMYPDRTPGYVEDMMSREIEEIETGDTTSQSDKDRASSGDWVVERQEGLNFVSLASDADERVDRFMEDFYPEPEIRFSFTSGGIGFAIDF